MNVEIGTVAVKFVFLGIFVSNLRYCVFAGGVNPRRVCRSTGNQQRGAGTGIEPGPAVKQADALLSELRRTLI